MKDFHYSCKAEMTQIHLIDQWLETTLTKEKVADYKGFVFACHELVINSVDAVQSAIENRCILLDTKLTINLKLTPIEMSFSITDCGGGLSDSQQNTLLSHLNDTVPEDPLQEFGRGTYLIRHLVDHYQYAEDTTGYFTYTISKKYT